MVLLAAKRHFIRFRRGYIAPDADRSSAVFVAMALVLLTMPVSYRAGTELVHPHTVFQVMVDQMRGVVHEHGDASSTAHAHKPASTKHVIASPFLSVNVPLSSYAAMISPELAVHALMTDQRVPGHLPLTMSPDVPNLTSLQAPPELVSALAVLALLLTLLLCRQPLHRIWFGYAPLTGIHTRLETPPPRFVA